MTLILPRPTPTYDPDDQAQTRRLLTQDANRARTIGEGGTGASTVIAARAALGIGQPGFSVYRATNQSLTPGGFVKVQFGAVEWNDDGCFDAVTNFRMNPQVAGRYQFTTGVDILALSGETPALIVSLFKNGVEYKRGDRDQSAAPVGGASRGIGGAFQAEANGTTDFFDIRVFHNNSGAVNVTGGQALTWFQGSLTS